MNHHTAYCLLTLSLLLGSHVRGLADEPATKFLVYIGSYAPADADGVHRYSLDAASGELTRLGGASGVKNPSFVAIHPNRRFLYTVAEIADFQGKRSGGVAAFSIDPRDGALTLLNQQSSGGPGACHLSVDAAGKNVLVANYTGGSMAVLPIDADGRLKGAAGFVQHEGSGATSGRQSGPHAHSVNLDAAGRFAFVADLGLDQILVYRFDAARGTLAPNDPPFVALAPGAGPRHFAFSPNGRFAYVINELDSTITAFRYDSAPGVLRPTQTLSTLPDDFEGTNWTAEVRVHPSGRFVYGSNRGHDSIAVFAVDQQSGKLRLVMNHSSGGETPRNFEIDPSGRWLLAANQATDNVVVLRIDGATGSLSATPHEISVPKPVCVKMTPFPVE